MFLVEGLKQLLTGEALIHTYNFLSSAYKQWKIFYIVVYSTSKVISYSINLKIDRKLYGQKYVDLISNALFGTAIMKKIFEKKFRFNEKVSLHGKFLYLPFLYIIWYFFPMLPNFVRW